ncbi:MAG: hypothetical protein HFI33_14245 [Lachnospiraceae bacterium]|nr:hypothetical protein [Lachnospiraceae bacterium]
MRLFVCKEMVSQIDTGIATIEENLNLLDKKSMESQYIYIYALFESTLTATVRYYLTNFPEKIAKNITVTKELIISSPLTSIIALEIINSYIRSYSSDTLSNYIEFYLKTLEISVDIDNNQIKNISNLRNGIVHDNLKDLSILSYVAQKKDEKAKEADLRSGALYLKQLLSKISIAVNDKYYKYTLEKVCRAIWEETFFTPLLKFDDVWKIDEDVIHIRNFEKASKKYTGLGSGEKLLFSIFLQQYNNSINDQLFKFRDLPAICLLDTNSREKIINILQLFIAHPYLFNGEKLN